MYLTFIFYTSILLIDITFSMLYFICGCRRTRDHNMNEKDEVHVVALQKVKTLFSYM